MPFGYDSLQARLVLMLRIIRDRVPRTPDFTIPRQFIMNSLDQGHPITAIPGNPVDADRFA
ncbi:hypothetical protein DPR02_00175 [Burkholderia cepacia]|uniref:Uncharacterized protein n=1 Tax=Burkholderia cepacia TaxID=292 RepID=A0AAQ0JLZ9_BURCE|nr:hypothetical protein DPR02_00175 [Burkholderia cepacia]